MTKNINKRAMYIASFLLMVALCAVLKYTAGTVAELMPECIFKHHTGLDCPACGNTRSVLALLNGDIFSAFLYNITPPVLIIVFFWWYIETGVNLFYKKVRLFPRTAWVWAPVFVLFFVYYIVRNLI